MAAKFAFSVLSLAATLISVAKAEDLASCGEEQYYPSEYTCYDDKKLCPITFGTPTLECDGVCYDKGQYRCVDGKVKQLPKASGPFILVAESDDVIVNGRVVNACGNYFAIGAGARQCPSCREITEDFNCASYGNQTVFLPNGKMVSDILMASMIMRGSIRMSGGLTNLNNRASIWLSDNTGTSALTIKVPSCTLKVRKSQAFR
jgi:hypothetical protein